MGATVSSREMSKCGVVCWSTDVKWVGSEVWCSWRWVCMGRSFG